MHGSFFGSRRANARVRQRARPGSGRRSLFERLERLDLMSADAVLDWNAVALAAQANDHTPSIVSTPDQGGPTRAARALAIVHAAIYDAVNSIDQSYAPYLVKDTFSKHASIDAAASQAAHDTLVALYPNQKAMFDAALHSSLADVPNGASENAGVAAGKIVARQILKARKNDGSQLVVDYVEGTAPGDHRVDPLHPSQGYLTPGWGEVKAFTKGNLDGLLPPPPPDLTSEEYATAFQDVKDFGGDGVTTPTQRTAEQTEIGIFWGYDGRPGLGTPPRLYNQIARTVAIGQGNTEVENARLFALINIAQADAGKMSWAAKYDYNFWRPILAIREADEGTGPSGLGDGNPATEGDPNWTPLGAPGSNGGTNFTPPFPAYVSGHATFGSAVFEILANFYGRDDISFSFTSDEFNGITTDAAGNVRPVVTRTFDSFSEAAAENAQSRIYLGIHWSFDASEGIRLGNAMADKVFSTLMQPRSTQPPGHGVDLARLREVLRSLLRSDEVTDAIVRAFARIDELPPRVARILNQILHVADGQQSDNRGYTRGERQLLTQAVTSLAEELTNRRLTTDRVTAVEATEAIDEWFGRCT